MRDVHRLLASETNGTNTVSVVRVELLEHTKVRLVGPGQEVTLERGRIILVEETAFMESDLGGR